MSDRILRITYVEEDALLGEALRRFLDESTTGIQVVVSEQQGPGSDRAVAMNEQLNDCDMMLVLCSEKSVVNPWLVFEVGSAWRQPGLVMVPICHSGLAEPPQPFSLFDCLVLEAPDFTEQLAAAITRVTTLPVGLDKAVFATALTAGLAPALVGDGKLDEPHLALLKQLATEPGRLMPLKWLVQATEQSEGDALVRLRNLCARDFAVELRRRAAVPRFRATEQGLTFLRDDAPGA